MAEVTSSGGGGGSGDNIFGCSIAGQGNVDPTFLLLVLFAVLYLALRRAGYKRM